MLNLKNICSSEQRLKIKKLESYFCNTQYRSKIASWNYESAGQGVYIPIFDRVPSIKCNLLRLIVNKYTDFLFGNARFPHISSRDKDTNDFLNQIIKDTRLRTKIRECRDNGGSSGLAVLSFAFIDGKPRIYNHKSSQVSVLSWIDKSELIPSEVLKSYKYTADNKEYYYAQLWTTDREIIWPKIKLDECDAWTSSEKIETVHNYGACPVVLIQNTANSDSVFGLADYDGLTDNAEEIDRLSSSISKGTQANVDPTLVIKMPENGILNNNESIKKGSDNALIVPDAKYLELNGSSIQAALELKEQLTQDIYNATGVILGDPKNTKALSGAALRMLYAPMMSKCDSYRDQYGDGIERLLSLILLAAKSIENQKPGEIYKKNGMLIQDKPTISVFNFENKKLTPGEIDVQLSWPRYFENTPEDARVATEAANAALGSTISEKTAVQYTSEFYEVQDIEQELIDIEKSKEKQLEALNGPLIGDLNLKE